MGKCVFCLVGTLLLLSSCGESHNDKKVLDMIEKNSGKERNDDKLTINVKSEGNILVSKYKSINAEEEVPQTSIKYLEDMELFPSTHDDSFSSPSGLKYITNGDRVNFETGTAMDSDANFTYGDAIFEHFYRDFDFRVDSADKSLNGENLGITLDPFKDALRYERAISIDIYAEYCSGNATVDKDHFVGTLNAAGVDAVSNNCTVLNPNRIILSNVDISKAGSNTSLAIKFRVYWDGALIDHVGTYPYTTYIKITEEGKKVSDYDDSILFYTENRQIIGLPDSATVTGYYIVDKEASTTTYCRGNDVASFEGMELNLNLEIAQHAE